MIQVKIYSQYISHFHIAAHFHNQQPRLASRSYQSDGLPGWVLGWQGALAGCLLMLSFSSWSTARAEPGLTCALDREWTRALTTCLCDAETPHVHQGQGVAMKLWEKYVPSVHGAGRKPRCETLHVAGWLLAWKLREEGSLQVSNCLHINQLFLSVCGWCVLSVVAKLATGLHVGDCKLELCHYFQIP